MKEKEKQSKALYILYIYISISISISRWITWCSENKLPRAIYKENYKIKYLRLFTPFPNLITKKSYNWWVIRRKWKFIQKYLKKNISKCRSQISESTKDQFAGENEVWEISQMHKKGSEITSQQTTDFATLRSGLSACDVRLPTCQEISGNFRRNSTALYKKAAKLCRNKRVISQRCAKFFLQLGVIGFQWL